MYADSPAITWEYVTIWDRVAAYREGFLYLLPFEADRLAIMIGNDDAMHLHEAAQRTAQAHLSGMSEYGSDPSYCGDVAEFWASCAFHSRSGRFDANDYRKLSNSYHNLTCLY